MEKLEMILGDARRALATLEEVLDESFSLIVRDASIQRFEYTFEVTWKLIRQYLKDREGIVCNSPKSCFREAFKVDLVTEEETVKALQMTDDRNMTTHTYREEVADEIYGNLPGYYDLMYNIITGVSERMN